METITEVRRHQRRVAVIGASRTELRTPQHQACGYDDDLVRWEPHLPGDHPPVSKNFLVGRIVVGAIAVGAPARCEQSKVDEVEGTGRCPTGLVASGAYRLTANVVVAGINVQAAAGCLANSCVSIDNSDLSNASYITDRPIVVAIGEPHDCRTTCGPVHAPGALDGRSRGP